MKGSSPAETWYAVDVCAAAAAAEAVESAFNALESAGTEINNLRKDPQDEVTVTGYFNANPDPIAARQAIDEYLAIYGLPSDAVVSVNTREVVNEDWLAEWKRHWRPTEAGKFVIAPPWSNVGATDKFVIRIEPNMAFGTGTHETTKLCLDAISRYFQPGDSFLDVGTGTGILAIAAAKLSETEAIEAYETDADSVAIARENAILNGVGNRIEFFHRPIDEETPARDLVCANVTLDVIAPMLPLLISKAKRHLVLSGILVEQRALIEDELAKYVVGTYDMETDGEWLSVIVSAA
jgi:ribosomal protein L11 methyltransferase